MPKAATKPARKLPAKLMGRTVHDFADPTVRGIVRTITTNYVVVMTAAGGTANIRRANVRCGGRPYRPHNRIRNDRRTQNRVAKKFERVERECGIGRDVVELRARHNGLPVEEALNALLGIGMSPGKRTA